LPHVPQVVTAEKEHIQCLFTHDFLRLVETKILISNLNIFYMTKRNEEVLSNLSVMLEFQNIFLGGVDTGAITVIWATAEIARNPIIMKKAQEEIRSSVGQKGRATEERTDELQYLKMVIKETLRLHPPAPLLLPRETMSRCQINGYDIYLKTLIQVNAWAIGRDPEYWRDSEEFFPERFVDSPIDYKGQRFEFLPLGSGRRVCPGILMGVTMVELALANLLYCFDWKLPNAVAINMEEAAGLTISKKNPLFLVRINYPQQAQPDKMSRISPLSKHTCS